MVSEAAVNHQDAESKQVIIIRPDSRGWRLFDFEEIGRYRDLAYFLVWRDITVMYAQSVLGFSWAIIQPLIQIVIFSVIFGKIAKIPTEGIPYVLFTTAAIIPWTYMSMTMTQSSNSLVTHQGMLGKIYFPRIFFPICAMQRWRHVLLTRVSSRVIRAMCSTR